MLTIKEICDGKIWRAVEGALNGLEKYGRSESFIIHMTVFGTSLLSLLEDNTVVFKPCGCLAICATQQLTGIDYTVENIGSRDQRANQIKIPYNDLYEFEGAVDALRNGHLGPIFDYFKKDRTLVSFRYLPVLHTGNWADNLGPYKELLYELKTLDL